MNNSSHNSSANSSGSSLASLFEYFHKIVALNDKEKEMLSALVKERNIRRRQFILQEEDVCKHFTYVVNGCLRMFNVG